MEGMALELNGGLPKLLGPVSSVYPFSVAARLSVRIMRKEGLIMGRRKKKTREEQYSTKLRDPIMAESGETVYLMPVIVKNQTDLANYQISWEDCKTLKFGSHRGDTVYYYRTENKALADICWAEVNTGHSREYRKDRCMIPGKRKPLIKCPDTNRCRECPYPVYRDKHLPNDISLDRMVEEGRMLQGEDHETRMSKTWMALEEVCKLIRQKNPEYELVIVLKEYCEYSVKEIAEIMGKTESNVRYLLKQAKEIGKKFNEGHIS